MTFEKMTSREFYASKEPGFVNNLARSERDLESAKPWVVLAFQRNVRGVRGVQIVAGYNRWTGDCIFWHLDSFDHDDRYDLTNAVEIVSEHVSSPQAAAPPSAV
jgi:hypothetical protein